VRALSHKHRVCAVPLFPSVPFKFARFVIFSQCSCMRALPHKHRICVVPFRRFPSVLHALLYSVMFLYACFASQTSGLCTAFPSAPFSLHALLYSAKFFYVWFASETSGFCSAIPSALFSLHALLYSGMCLYACFSCFVQFATVPFTLAR